MYDTNIDFMQNFMMLRFLKLFVPSSNIVLMITPARNTDLKYVSLIIEKICV